jgi:hypothetical protein
MDKQEHHKVEEQHEHHKPTHAHTQNDETVERKPVDSKKSLKFILIVFGIIVLIIATTIILGKYVLVNKNVVEYNNYIFYKSENIWSTQQLIKGQLYDIPFHNNPKQVLDIPVDPQAIDQIRGFSNNTNGVVYIVVDPYESAKVVLAGVEYARLLGDVYNIYNMKVKSAISTPVDVETTSPVITCKNQSKNTMVIYQTVTDKNLVSINGNCIILESIDINESVRVADAFAFRLLNIITE